MIIDDSKGIRDPLKLKTNMTSLDGVATRDVVGGRSLRNSLCEGRQGISLTKPWARTKKKLDRLQPLVNMVNGNFYCRRNRHMNIITIRMITNLTKLSGKNLTNVEIYKKAYKFIKKIELLPHRLQTKGNDRVLQSIIEKEPLNGITVKKLENIAKEMKN